MTPAVRDAKRFLELADRYFHWRRRGPSGVSEKSGLGWMFAVLVDASASGYGIKPTPATGQELEGLRKNSGAKPPSQLH
jgi:hypothetical protein